MQKAPKQKCVIYIGDFDLRNENVQAHLVKNNAKILNRLGYKVFFIGVNRDANIFKQVETLSKFNIGKDGLYLELPNTLSLKGVLEYRKVAARILLFMDEIAQSNDVKFVISYQSPTYALVLKKIAVWCREKNAKYIVNSADIPIFDAQPLFRRIVMKWNWQCMHNINKKYEDGLISVSRYIDKFYHKDGMPSVIIPPLFDDYADNGFKLADKVTFVYAGTPFVLNKNVKISGMKDRLDKIIDYCLRLSDAGVAYRLLVIGITKDLYANCIPRHKGALDSNSDISFLGRRSHTDTIEAVKNADYMLNIRDVNVMNEAGLSTKLVESVSLGTPVVMNSVGDNFLYLREGVTGYELKGNSERDVAVLGALCNRTKEERLALKQNCAGDRPFSLDRFEPILNSFLKEVSLN